MIYTTKELLEKGETEYSIRNRVKDKTLFLIERGYYSDQLSSTYKDEVLISKKYPSAILTGPSAFFIYGLTDYIPEHYYLATAQHSFPIRKDHVKQSYQDQSFLNVGVVEKQIDGGVVKTYNLERLLIELFRLKEKYPKEMYYEVINSFRKIKDKIDFFKVNEYLKSFSYSEGLSQRIKEAM